MKHISILCLCLVLIATIARAHGQCGSAVKPHKQGSTALVRPIPPATKDWVEKKLLDGKSVMLTNSYLFQVMKGMAQENQKLAEEAILIPLLHETLKGLVDSASDEDVRRLLGVALLLLVHKPEVDLPEQAKEQARAIKRNPLFTPRGHYTSSDELQRYFQAMQYLSKATVDVSVKPDAFPFPQEMLYPFETAEKVREIFSRPENTDLLEKWRAIHSFYDSINGSSDLPTFVDLMDEFKDTALTKQTVEEWIQKNRMPKINPEMGLGIQPFGERFSLHQATIDEVKRKLIKQDTPREEMAKILRLLNLMNGSTADGEKIQGLAVRIPQESVSSYYDTTLRAISIGGRGWQKDSFKLNFFAASLTGLAEQTALMTKTSTVVAKSAPGPLLIKSGLNLYFEPGSEQYLLALARSSDTIVKTCNDLRKVAGAQVGVLEFSSPAQAFRTFAALAKQGKPLVTGSPEWSAHSKLMTELPRNPTVTVDVLRFRDRAGKYFFYQWAIAPFEAAYDPLKAGGHVPGLDLVFFEAWADTIIPDTNGPLTNFQWQERVSRGRVNCLSSILRVPDEKGVVQ